MVGHVECVCGAATALRACCSSFGRPCICGEAMSRPRLVRAATGLLQSVRLARTDRCLAQRTLSLFRSACCPFAVSMRCVFGLSAGVHRTLHHGERGCLAKHTLAQF